MHRVSVSLELGLGGFLILQGPTLQCTGTNRRLPVSILEMRARSGLLCGCLVVVHAVAMIAAAAFGQDVRDATGIGKIRENARNYVEQLGLLTCTENTRQTVRVADVTLSERREDGCDTTSYKLFAVQAIGLAGPEVNLRRASADWRERLREASLGTATGFLATLADTGVDADFRWVRMARATGRREAVISFRVSALNGYVLADTIRTTRVPYKGLIYADPKTGAFVRIEIKCIDIPRDSDYEGADAAIDFSSFRVNGRMVDLPARSVVRFQMKRGDATNEADYSSYRLANFGTDTQIRFVDESADEKKRGQR